MTRDNIDEVDTAWEAPEEVEDLRPGTHVSVRVSVLEASGLPTAYSHNLFCQYKFWRQEEALIIPPLIPSMGSEAISSPAGVHKFEHHQTFSVEVTEDFLEYIGDGALPVEVWGHRRSGFDSSPDTGTYTVHVCLILTMNTCTTIIYMYDIVNVVLTIYIFIFKRNSFSLKLF